MKIAQILLAYLRQEKKLCLPGLGILIYQDTSQPADAEDSSPLSIGQLSFHQDPKTKSDDQLILFISRETGKMVPLAAADFESYMDVGRQLLNIQSPFILDGIGYIQKGPDGLHFTGETSSVEEEIAQVQPVKPSAQRKIHPKTQGDSYLLLPRKQRMHVRRLAAAMALIILGLAVIGWLSYFLYLQSRTGIPEVQTGPVRMIQLANPPADSVSQQVNATDSLALGTVHQVKAISNMPARMLVVVESCGKKRAMKRYADLREWGHKPVIRTTDSVIFKIAIPVEAPLSDSIRHRDSLSHFFGRKTWIEMESYE